jgi:hypothetical protein
MAAVDDERGVQNQVYDLADEGELVELRALLEEHPEVDVDGYRGSYGRSALNMACERGHTECAQLLIDHNADVNATDIPGQSALINVSCLGHLGCVRLLVQNGADVNCQSNNGCTPLMSSAIDGRPTIAHYLLEQKADLHYRTLKGGNKNNDALYCAMRQWHTNQASKATDRKPGIAFAFLSCDTDAKNILIDDGVTIAVRDTHIETYSHVQAYVDEYHRILNFVLSDHVQVDTRVGRGDKGIYQEPLERTLEYLGLSMTKDQVVNTSIDGEAVRRALIPGHLLNANHWFDKHERRRLFTELAYRLNASRELTIELEAELASFAWSPTHKYPVT